MDAIKTKRSFSSCNLSSTSSHQVDDVKECKRKFGNHHLWTISDAIEIEKNVPKVSLPLKSFNHIAREVISLEKSRRFYVDVLGFTEVPRPPFDCEGYWLYGYGLSLHLVATTVPEYRRQLKRSRIEHFSTCLPQVDHIAFMTDDVDCIRDVLDKAQVYYKLDRPSDSVYQLFMFDPDGNVIEVSNCQHINKSCPLDLQPQEERHVVDKKKMIAPIASIAEMMNSINVGDDDLTASGIDIEDFFHQNYEN